MKISYLLGLALAPALLSACGNGNGSSELAREQTAITFESYSVDAIARMSDADSTRSDETDLMRVVAEGVLPVSIGGNAPTELRDSLERMGGVSFAADGTAQPRLESGATLTSKKAAETQACSLAATTLSVTMLTPRVIVWKSSAYYYICGAAHGMTQSRFLSYDREAGKILSPADVFRAGYEEPLTALLRSKLKDMPDLLVPLESIEIPAEFSLTPDGVLFNYGVYAIAPYSSGEIPVYLTANDIYELLSAKGKELIYGESADTASDDPAQNEIETRE